jgi:two-component sensor histidine kinase/DNA-binding response OmpR family regulator
MTSEEKVNILLVDDQPSKLLTYEVILRELGDNLIKASSGKEALEQLLKNEIAVVLMDVCMPELDGFELASMIRGHPRFQKIAMIFISAIHLAEIDHLRGYEMGAVDYVPVPVIPQVLRAKVRVFTDLFRKSRQLERLNAELEDRVVRRTAELEASTTRLLESEHRRSLALSAGQMGSWDWDLQAGKFEWDEGQHSIYGLIPGQFAVTPENLKVLILPEDWEQLQVGLKRTLQHGEPHQAEFRVRRPNGEIRWCATTAAATRDFAGNVSRISGVTIDITDRKQAEERQALLAQEVDHRAKNAMAIVQSIVRLTKAVNITDYAAIIEGRIKALSRAHAILSDTRWQGADLSKLVEDELAPYRTSRADRIHVSGPNVLLDPTTAQTLALALHELATNAAKYGALSNATGKLELKWDVQPDSIVFHWREAGGPVTQVPAKTGFGTRIITGSVERQLGGKATFDWKPEGLTCALFVPRGRTGNLRDHSVAEHAGILAPKTIQAQRIMIVEDEALVAMVLEEQLQELGLSIVAICATVSEAMKAIDETSPGAAILDVNLGGQLVYPVADRLSTLGTPFVFVTGYGRESIDRRFSSAVVLEKPVERHVLGSIFGNGRAGDYARNACGNAETRNSDGEIGDRVYHAR